MDHAAPGALGSRRTFDPGVDSILRRHPVARPQHLAATTVEPPRRVQCRRRGSDGRSWRRMVVVRAGRGHRGLLRRRLARGGPGPGPAREVRIAIRRDHPLLPGRWLSTADRRLPGSLARPRAGRSVGRSRPDGSHRGQRARLGRPDRAGHLGDVVAHDAAHPAGRGRRGGLPSSAADPGHRDRTGGRRRMARRTSIGGGRVGGVSARCRHLDATDDYGSVHQAPGQLRHLVRHSWVGLVRRPDRPRGHPDCHRWHVGRGGGRHRSGCSLSRGRIRGPGTAGGDDVPGPGGPRRRPARGSFGEPNP